MKQFNLLEKVNLPSRLDIANDSIVISAFEGLLQVTCDQCECGFYKAMGLTCRHIFAVRQHKKVPLFSESLCHIRWTKDYYQANHCVFSNISVDNVEVVVGTVEPSKASSILSQHQKYRKAFAVAQRLATIASESAMREFGSRIDTLQRVATA